MSQRRAKRLKRQRRISDCIMKVMCNGDYVDAFRMLEISRTSEYNLTPLHEGILRRILLRLMKPCRRDRRRKLNGFNQNSDTLEDLLLERMGIPRETLEEIYEEVVSGNFHTFYNYLHYAQTINHAIQVNLQIFTNHCMRVKLAEQEIETMESNLETDPEMGLLYTSITFTLGLLFFFYFIYSKILS
ncbi:uncharacterized protein [Drosophila takahashii]|uniref:uncharacterized protein n=1 Tax=Drosophila takahashii TaxID=29030 RepID=UPI001CF8AA01|nr:uncharacterized protein LOC108055907 [Drosophila takahashii]XP_016994959.2 uncharacterized protein LOC108055907 [Drosophila takahashii]